MQEAAFCAGIEPLTAEGRTTYIKAVGAAPKKAERTGVLWIS